MDKFSKTSSSKYQNRYSEEFKRSICQIYSDSNSSINFIETKYSIGKGRLSKWLNEYGFKVKLMYLVSSARMDTSQNNIESPSNDVDLVRKLKEQLGQARFEAESPTSAELCSVLSLRIRNLVPGL